MHSYSKTTTYDVECARLCSDDIVISVLMYVCVRAYACARVCVSVFVFVCVCVCVDL